MILVDTSVLIGYLKGSPGPVFEKFDEMIAQGVPFGINGYIYQEVLQGAGDEKEYVLLVDYLSPLPFYSLLHGRSSFESAARIFFLCRRSGITLRSTVDLLIAQTALENGLYLLHHDRDFSNMGKVIPELKLMDCL
jgi:predicted nucleic acid-binding protein